MRFADKALAFRGSENDKAKQKLLAYTGRRCSSPLLLMSPDLRSGTFKSTRSVKKSKLQNSHLRCMLRANMWSTIVSTPQNAFDRNPA